MLATLLYSLLVSFRHEEKKGERETDKSVLLSLGDWYGNVCPSDVSEIIEKHVLSGETVYRLWRGRMGLDKATVQHLSFY